ncbi:MAG TPA: hypothetical protein VKY92_12100 [Verrucomicrobiae bacterium]|nr:hypothetical protein [Verrucomicrobiae bacterium]
MNCCLSRYLQIGVLSSGCLIGTVSLSLLPSVSKAQDNVTVPKSRLEELERKEKELERLKGDLDKSKEENTKLKKENEKVVARPVQAPAPEPVPTYVSPPLESLPTLRPDEVVDSMDLANYYRGDLAAADHRFLKQKLTVRGEIVGFEKPLWKRSYRVFLKTPSHDTKVMCDLLPPAKAEAVFTANHGEELVALINETRIPIAKVGQQVVIKGECKGFSDSVVTIVAWEMKAVANR